MSKKSLLLESPERQMQEDREGRRMKVPTLPIFVIRTNYVLEKYQSLKNNIKVLSKSLIFRYFTLFFGALMFANIRIRNHE